MRRFLAITGLIFLTACGGGSTRSVSGEIAQACVKADRSAANPRLCGCIQQAANQTLRPADRSRVADFFADPEVAHAMRINDSPFAEAFWDRYSNFIDTSRAMCG